MPALSLVALVSLVSTVFAKQLDAHPPQQQHRHWAPICSGNPTNKIRGCDRYGCGNFGADRHSGKGKHAGVDVICSDGATVYAPFSGHLSGPIRFFHNGNAIDDGVQITGSGNKFSNFDLRIAGTLTTFLLHLTVSSYCVKLVCIHPIRYHGQIQRGQQLGRMLPMQKVFPGIISHIHVENCDHSDPTHLLTPVVPPFPQQDRHWATLCSGNPTNEIRGCDKYGCGYYGAPRHNGKGRHTGVDVICSDGANVYAPFSGQLSGPIKFFHNGNAIDDGVQIRGSGFCVKLLCIHPIRYNGRISKGQILGRMLPMQRVFPGITSHIHVENCDRSDPTSNLERGKGQRE
ncbi:myeloid protein 1-like protein [Amazona aestiva]|uniref:Myeloid protein 1-like protein n=1 Tax=Amazona aestiva TaxID=12930 RepID=A0A0Q3M3H3_AMAAE|nr:myeloid protein 1-like protein [Amazona aestiva]